VAMTVGGRSLRGQKQTRRDCRKTNASKTR
jgi:hypothetical protein